MENHNDNDREDGFIYFRDNDWYQSQNLYKIGITECLVSRGPQYITGEPRKGKFVAAFKVPLGRLRELDQWMKTRFQPWNVVAEDGGGNEFYKREIIDEIFENALQETGVNYVKLSSEEMQLIEKKIKEKISPPPPPPPATFTDPEDMVPIEDTPAPAIQLEPFTPHEHQSVLVSKALSYFSTQPIGKIYWACGTGKTLASIMIAQAMKPQTVLIGVYSRFLRNQFCNAILKIFPINTPILFVGSTTQAERIAEGKDTKDNEDDNSEGGDEQGEPLQSTTDVEKVNDFLLRTAGKGVQFVITTYASCGILRNLKFGFKIGDEAHHLVGNFHAESTTGYKMFHQITADHTLFMTATEKTVEQPLRQTTNPLIRTYSMEDTQTFGHLIDEPLTVKWAIENKKITDYVLLVLKNSEEQVEEIIRRVGIAVSNRELFISAYMCLLSFCKYPDLTHMLLYTNYTNTAEQAENYISQLLQLDQFAHLVEEGIYHQALHSQTRKLNIQTELQEFRQSTRGIISCAYIFGEGFDEPALNGVCIAENMNSEIRITQFVLRPNRKNPLIPDKVAYVINPFIDTADWQDPTLSYEKVRRLVSHLRNVDETVGQKIKLCTISLPATESEHMDQTHSPDSATETGAASSKQLSEGMVEDKDDEDEEDEDEPTAKMGGRRSSTIQIQVEENEEELKKFKIRLRRSKALRSKLTGEEEEYLAFVEMNILLKVQSKEQYNGTIPRDHPFYIEDPETYFTGTGTWKGWYDFLGVNVSQFIQTQSEWKETCRSLGINNRTEYLKACDERQDLPRDPGEFYQGFTNMAQELDWSRRRRN